MLYKILLAFISLPESLLLKPSGLRQTEMGIFALSLSSFLALGPVAMLPEMSFASSAKWELGYIEEQFAARQTQDTQSLQG